MTTTEPITLTPRMASDPSCCTPITLRLSDGTAADLAEVFKALADPTRLQILDILSQSDGQVCVCDFEGVVGVPNAATGQRPRQATISHHLRVLREAGLIGSEKHHQWVYYFVFPERLAVVRAILNTLG